MPDSETPPPASQFRPIPLPVGDAPESDPLGDGGDDVEEDGSGEEESLGHPIGSDLLEKQRQSEDEEKGGASSSLSIAKEYLRRRNFAIISHPDAGKTTLVSKSIR